MQAITIEPGRAKSAALEQVAEPAAEVGSILVQTLGIGICGTDADLLAGKYGAAPPEHKRLVIGHESLGRVLEAPAASGFTRGDLVAGIVRHPDPVPCASCASGEWDMCSNGLYTERGIKARDGFCAERFRVEPGFAIKLDPVLGLCGVLVEPASVVAKAWDHITRIAERTRWQPRSVLVTGAGAVGLLAALLGRQRGLEVHVLDHHADGPKPDLVRALGAQYHSGALAGIGFKPDILIECTGAPDVIAAALQTGAPNGIVCLTGVPPVNHRLDFDLGLFSNGLVMNNGVVFGSVKCQPGALQRLCNGTGGRRPRLA